VVSVESLAREHECLGEVDPADGARSIDLDMLHGSLSSRWSSPPEHSLIIDGHLSHHLPSDAVAVLRCSPDVLEARLASRGYSAEKTQANCEWELLGGAWNERERGSAWIEFDTTNSDVASVVESLLHWISDGFKPASPGSVIDWVARMEE
jgi:adenylate kinase